MELKEKCKAVREKMGLTQQYFAEVFLHTNQIEVSFIERGFIPEDIRKIKAIETLYDNLIEITIGTIY